MAYKSKPYGIRFDLEKVELVKQKEGVTTYQQVVDFFLNEYWWRYKMAKPTHRGVPPIPKYENNLADSKNGIGIVNNPPPKPKTVEQYISMKRELETDEQWAKLWAEVESAAHLTNKQKQIIKNCN